MNKLNTWQTRIASLEGAFLSVTGEVKRKAARKKARDYAQMFAASVSVEQIPVYSICCPELLTRVPDQFQEDNEGEKDYAIPSSRDLIRWNIEEVVTQHLRQRWDAVHETEGYDPREDTENV